MQHALFFFSERFLQHFLIIATLSGLKHLIKYESSVVKGAVLA